MKTLLLLLLCLITAAEVTDISSFIDGNGKFSAALYGDVPNWNRDTDILLSPFSLQTVLALTQSAAKGTTGEEIRTAASLPSSSEETETAMKIALSQVQSKIHNKIYVENGFSTNDDFKTLASDVYQSSFEDIEFINVEAAAKSVNEWAGEHTSNRFANYFARGGDFNKLSKDLLINTLSMKKNWSIPFGSGQTKPEYFYGEGNNRYSVSMMTQGPFLYNYFESAELDAKFLDMSLDQNATFTIVLPNRMDGLSKVEKKIDVALTVPEYIQEFIQLSLPRIYIQATYLNLKGSMQRLGIKNAWNNDEADLSGMTGVPGQISAYDLVQNTFINVGETGIEAVAGGLLHVRVPSSKHFYVNHPFLFYVRVNGIIVFVGKVVNPTYTVHH